jgi:hypothetical protein
LLPSVFTVTDLGDSGIGSDLQGDLRYCITQANANADPSNQVVFDPSLSGTITLTQGPLTISKDLEIDGPGRGLVTVSGNHQSGVFNIGADPGVQTVTMSGLTIADGTGILVGGQLQGGGIYNDHAHLTVSNCTVSGNDVGIHGNGGGIYNKLGTLTVNSSTISGNAGSRGGGIYNYFGTVVVSASTVSANTLGGGIYCEYIGELTVDSCTIADNQSFEWGAGIFSQVPTTITRSTISGNSGVGFGSYGGGIYLGGGGSRQTMAAIRDSAIVGNTAVFAGGLYNIGDTVLLDHTIVSGNDATQVGAGGVQNQGSMTITACTISDNIGSGIATTSSLVMTGSTVSGNVAYSLGGALDVGYGDAQISNCTLSGNTARGAGGGIALWAHVGTLELTSVTITGNTASGTNGDFIGGGGLAFLAPESNQYVLLRNTLIAGNSTATIDPDVRGTVISLGFNLVGLGGDSQGWRANDLVGQATPIDPILGPLRDNGGPTRTHALLAGSPAIVHGDPALHGTTDQRGTPRFHSGVNAPVDIGAFDETALQGFRLDAPAHVVAGQPFTITVTALDGQGNTASTFTGSIRFSSSDQGAMLPPNYHFVASDGGVATFTVTLATAGAQRLQVDTVGFPDWQGTTTVDVADASPPGGGGGSGGAASAAAPAGPAGIVSPTASAALFAGARPEPGSPVIVYQRPALAAVDAVFGVGRPAVVDAPPAQQTLADAASILHHLHKGNRGGAAHVAGLADPFTEAL